MKKCRDIQKIINRLCDNEYVSNEEKSIVKKHIHECKKCYNLYEFNLKLKDSLNVLSYPEVSQDIVNKINYEIINLKPANDVIYNFIKKLSFVPLSLVLVIAVIWSVSINNTETSLTDSYYLAQLTDVEKIVFNNEVSSNSVLKMVIDDSNLDG